MKNYYKDFISVSNNIHNFKYDYSKVNYVNARTKVCIICPIHGEFWQEPFVHKKGSGCKFCSFKRQISNHKLNDNKNKFFNKLYKLNYDYSKVEYKNMKSKICVICNKHGEFYITPYKLIQGGKCNLCETEEKTNDFIIKSKKFIMKNMIIQK